MVVEEARVGRRQLAVTSMWKVGRPARMARVSGLAQRSVTVDDSGALARA